MKKLFLTTLLMLVFTSINAQSKKKQDKESIKKMCGCFEISFNFSETFNYSKDSLYKPSKKKQVGALEWAQLVVDENNEISIQHLLQMGDTSDAYVMKHWRQDWLYQNRDFYMYNGDNNWLYQSKPKTDVKKQWTQKVYQVDDSPRYEGSGTWVHIDGKSYWENTADAPLPRREYTKRNDYNITVRNNRQEITEYGWVHDQDNNKVLRKEGTKDVTIASEKGYNIYKRLPDERCKAAQNWWVKNQEKWMTVKSKWNEVFARNKNLSLRNKVDNKLLYKYLFSKKFSSKNKIDSVIESFIK